MRDEFVPLDAFLRPAPREPEVAPVQAPTVARAGNECEDAIRAARRFRAGLADAVDAAVARLLPEIARTVLARELRLHPADVAAIVAGVLERYAGEKALTLRAHPADVDALADLPIAVVADGALLRGDAVLELHSGTIDLRLDSRLHAILQASA
ncbi:MAG TPA: FliH/SctL family protein [Candidatus Cybelea sp.]